MVGMLEKLKSFFDDLCCNVNSAHWSKDESAKVGVIADQPVCLIEGKAINSIFRGGATII